MTPHEAAAVLGVPVGSTAGEIEAAFVRLARQTHPDRLVGAQAEEVAAASAAFIRVSDARLVLLQVRAQALATPPPPPRSPWPLRVWAALLLPGTAVTLSGSGLAYPAALAVVPLVAVVIALAVTGRRELFALSVLLGVVFAALTVVLASFSALVALALLQVPVMAILILRTPRSTRAGPVP